MNSKNTPYNHPLTKIITYSEEMINGLDELTSEGFEARKDKFSDYSQIYPFTTENLSGYMTRSLLEDKSVLTVGASGDQIINAYMLGAKKVSAFDINSLASLYCELKFSALANLSYNQFKDFLLKDYDNYTPGLGFQTYNFQTYNILKSSISTSAQIFFDKMFAEFGNDGWGLRCSSVFKSSSCEFDEDIKINPYLHSEENYMKAQASMPESIDWFNYTLQQLPVMLNKKFDIILLSNIMDYAKTFVNEEDYLKSFSEKYIVPLFSHLNDDGMIFAAYIYNADKTENPDRIYRSQIDNPRLRREVFQSLNIPFREYYFDSVIQGKKDAVIILQK